MNDPAERPPTPHGEPARAGARPRRFRIQSRRVPSRPPHPSFGPAGTPRPAHRLNPEPPAAATDVVQFCRSRNQGRRCTRPLAHAGLHRHRTIMWADGGADAAHCPGSGEPGEPAATLADGFPDGRALCPVCLRFIDLDDARRLIPHDTSDADETDADALRRREWFNVHGW